MSTGKYLHRKVALLLSCLIFSACQTSKEQEPILIKPVCPAELTAEIRVEPIAPHEAIVNDAGRDWLAIDMLPYTRDIARRLAAGRAWCLTK
jgi:hypothetical protein